MPPKHNKLSSRRVMHVIWFAVAIIDRFIVTVIDRLKQIVAMLHGTTVNNE